MKKKASYTIDAEILGSFSRRTKKLAINKSALIEKLIKDWLQIEEEKDNAIKKWVKDEKGDE